MSIARATLFPAYGTLSGANGTDAITIANSGDIMFAATWIFPNTDTVSAPSSSKVTWTPTPAVINNDTTNGLWLALWTGLSTATGTDTVTFTGVGTPSFAAYVVDEFHDSVAATWSVHTASSTSGATGTAVTFPSLAAADSGSMYWGFATVGSGTLSGTNGTPTGCVYLVQGTETATVFNPALPNGSAVAPAMTVSTSSDWDTVGVVVSSIASAPASNGQFFQFFGRASGATGTPAPTPIDPPVIS